MKYLWFGSCWLALLLSACSTPATRQPDAPIRIRWTHDPETLDPLALPNQNAIDAANLLRASLLQLDLQTSRYAPCLAESLPTVRLISDSLTQADYHLRVAATWDDGRPVLASDVDFTLKLMSCPGLPNEGVRSQFDFIRQFLPDPADPRHFQLVCRGQAQEYAWESGDFSILPEEALDPTHSLRRFSLAMVQRPSAAATVALAALAKRYQQADLAHHPQRIPGCGPYQLVAWQANRYLIFRRKSPWWGDQLHPAPVVLQAQPTQLQFSILPDDAAAMLALRRHELDLYPRISARDFQRLRGIPAARRELDFYSGSSYDVVYAGFNTQRPMLRDKLTRQALSCLFDPAGLLAGTQLGQGKLTVGLLAPGSPYYNDSLALPAYSPAKAQALLRQAGWRQVAGAWQRAPAQRLALSVRYRASDATFETVALQFRAAAAKLGIPVELRPTESTVLTTSLHQGDFDLYVRVLKGTPFSFNFAPILHSRAVSEGNFTGFQFPPLDYLLENITKAGPTSRKRHLLRRFQVLLRDEAPLAPLFFMSYHLVADRHLQHLLPSGLKPGYAATTLTWVDSLPTTGR